MADMENIKHMSDFAQFGKAGRGTTLDPYGQARFRATQPQQQWEFEKQQAALNNSYRQQKLGILSDALKRGGGGGGGASSGFSASSYGGGIPGGTATAAGYNPEPMIQQASAGMRSQAQQGARAGAESLAGSGFGSSPLKNLALSNQLQGNALVGSQQNATQQRADAARFNTDAGLRAAAINQQAAAAAQQRNMGFQSSILQALAGV